MTLLDRLALATIILVAVFLVGGVLFFFAREIVLRFASRFDNMPVPKRLLLGVLGYPVIVVYGFAINTVVGVILLLPLLFIVAMPELTSANWRGEPSIELPDRVQLSEDFREVDGRLETRLAIDGENWSAEFPADGLPPPSRGDYVRVIDRDGLKLILGRSGPQV